MGAADRVLDPAKHSIENDDIEIRYRIWSKPRYWKAALKVLENTRCEVWPLRHVLERFPQRRLRRARATRSAARVKKIV